MEHLETNMYLCTMTPILHTSLMQVLLIAPHIDPSWLLAVTSCRKEFPTIHTFLRQNVCASISDKVWVDCPHVDDKMHHGDVISASCVQNSAVAHMGDLNGVSMRRTMSIVDTCTSLLIVFTDIATCSYCCIMVPLSFLCWFSVSS